MPSHSWLGAGAFGGVAPVLLLTFSPLAGAHAAPTQAQALARWSGHVGEASDRFGIPEEWIWRVMRAESRGRTTLDGRPITSPAGAMGLMQLMPGTWAEMRAKQGLGSDPHDPRDNILAGTAYLRLMYDRFGYPGLFAAYNAGPTRLAAHLARGRRLPAETVAYVAAVGSAQRGRLAAHLPEFRSGGLFVARSASRLNVEMMQPHAAPSSIFVQLGTPWNSARN